MIESKPPGDYVQAVIDIFGGALQAVLDVQRVSIVQVTELRFAGEYRVDRTQQPVEREFVPGFLPLPQLGLHSVAGVGPFGTNFGESQIALGQFGPTAVDAIKNVHNDVKGLVRASDLVNMQINLVNTENPVQATDVGTHFFCMFGTCVELRDESTKAVVTLLHQIGHVHP